MSASTGKQLWTWRPSYPAGFTGGDPLGLTGTGAGLLVEYGERTRSTGDGVPVAAAVPRTAVLVDPAKGTEGASFRVSGALLTAGSGVAVYLDGSAVGLELSSGRQVFTTSLATVAGFHPVTATTLAGSGYLLLRGPTSSGRVNGDGGPLAVLSLNLGTGQVTGTAALQPDLESCRPATDGRTLCGLRPAALAVGAGAVFVAELRDDELALTALD